MQSKGDKVVEQFLKDAGIDENSPIDPASRQTLRQLLLNAPTASNVHDVSRRCVNRVNVADPRNDFNTVIQIKKFFGNRPGRYTTDRGDASGTGYWFLVMGTNSCGEGPLGTWGEGAERDVPACGP